MANYHLFLLFLEHLVGGHQQIVNFKMNKHRLSAADACCFTLGFNDLGQSVFVSAKIISLDLCRLLTNRFQVLRVADNFLAESGVTFQGFLTFGRKLGELLLRFPL